jgi:proton-translocating NADH-quinone oxidoreductase chain L
MPLLGYISGSFFGRFLGHGVCYITFNNILISFFISTFLFFDILRAECFYTLDLNTWFKSDTLFVSWGFCFDSLTSIMLLVVTFISTLVHLYSIEYMRHDPHLERFMSYLSLFTFFMLMLVTSNNFLQMFVGWEGVGLSSYLLINFWFTRIQANKAAIKAMLVNRVGDFFLLISVFICSFVFNTLDYNIVFSLAPLFVNYCILIGTFKIALLDLMCFFIFLGAMGKSAQIGLHTWLPDAMEGPTPVSALIHAATMVTAGVFLIARCSFLFEFSPFCLNLVTVIGASTAFFAATTGLFQNDIKKVIAYSTCSQLGYMIFACGLSGYDVGIFHLSNHAFFKALLFLGAGSIIHAVNDEQDMRYMGGLQRLMPFSYSIMVVGSLALIGFPFLSGFYSKDTILEIAYAKYTSLGHYAYVLGTLSAFLTSFYSTRLICLVFLAKPNGTRQSITNAHEGSLGMTLPLFILSIFSMSVGYLTQDLFIGFGTSFWAFSILILPYNYSTVDIEFISLLYKLLPLIVTIIGSATSFILYTFSLSRFFSLKQNNYVKNVFNFFSRKWYFDRLYNQLLGQSVLELAYTYTYGRIDRGLLETFGPTGLSFSLMSVSTLLVKLQSGYTFQYLFLFIFFIFVYLLWVLKVITILIPIPILLILCALSFLS